MTTPAADVYERLVNLADEASWYEDEHQDTAARAAALHDQAARSTGADRRRLARQATAVDRHAALAATLADRIRTQHRTLLETLPETAPDITAEAEPEGERRAALGLRLRDALERKAAAAHAADRHFATALAAQPWQRTRRETALLRGRYAEACVQVHADTVRSVRAEIDALVRDRLGLL